jgi:hypothetical protein
MAFLDRSSFHQEYGTPRNAAARLGTPQIPTKRRDVLLLLLGTLVLALLATAAVFLLMQWAGFWDAPDPNGRWTVLGGLLLIVPLAIATLAALGFSLTALFIVLGFGWGRLQVLRRVLAVRGRRT